MPAWIQDLFRRLLGRSSLGTGEGIEVTYVHTWPWPPWITLIFLIAAAAYVGLIYWREPGKPGRAVRLTLATIRLTLIALVLTMMYGWMRNEYRTDLPDVVVAVDDSESMSIVDSYDSARLVQNLQRRLESIKLERLTRFNLAKLCLLDDHDRLLQTLDDRYNLRFYWISRSARPEDSQIDSLKRKIRGETPIATTSRLGNCVRSILEMQRGRPTAAVILLTDGVATEGTTISEVAPLARRKGVPLYLVGLGEDKPPRDLRLGDLLVDETVFLGDLVHFDATVTGTGFDSNTVHVRLKNKKGGKLLAEQEVVVAGDGRPHPVRLVYRPTKEGPLHCIVEVDPLEAEVNLENNRLVRVIQVRDETIRVLFVQEYPSYEFRYLNTLLERGLNRGGTAKAIQLTTVLQEADAGFVELDKTAQRVFPVSRDQLFAYDVVIFGDVNPSYLSRPAMENLAAFVQQRGGGLVLIAGPRHTPLAYRDTPLETLFPIKLDTASLPDPQSLIEQSFRPEPTRLGVSSPQLQLADDSAESLDVWQHLPRLRWLLAAPDLRPATRVLAEHPTRTGPNGRRLPVICSQFVGAGKVLFHATDESYLWARFRGNDQYYERYWLQTIRYLSRSKLLGDNRTVEITLERTRYYRGEPIPLSVRFLDDRMAPAADDGVTVVLQREEGRRRKVMLQRSTMRRGLFEGTVTNLSEGDYRVWLAVPTLQGKPPSRHFRILPPPGEHARVEMDSADLKRAAKITQGNFYTINTVHRLIKDLPRGRQVRIDSLPSTPIWNSFWLAGLVVLLLLTEWLLRRRVGWL